MKVFLLGLLGLILGLIGGGALGVGVGSICVEVFQVRQFEGGAGMMVFFTFMPVGAIIGAILGAWLLGLAARPQAAAQEQPGWSAHFERAV
jgi:MFS family permease